MSHFTVEFRKATGKNLWAYRHLTRVRQALNGRIAKASWIGPDRSVIRVDCQNTGDAVLARLVW